MSGAGSLLSADPKRPPDEAQPCRASAEAPGPPKQWPINRRPHCALCRRAMHPVWVGGERFWECGFHGSRGRLKA